MRNQPVRAIPKVEYVNGYEIIEAGNSDYKVLSSDGPLGGGFNTFKDAHDYAYSLPPIRISGAGSSEP